MVKYLKEIGNLNSDELTDEQKKEMKDLKKKLEKYKQMELVGKGDLGSNSDSSDK